MRLQPKYALVVALLLAVGTCYYYTRLLLPRAHQQRVANAMATGYAYGGDFYPIWLTGRALLLHRENPYMPATTREIQTGLFGRPMDPLRPGDPPADFRAFSYPLYADLLVAPLLALDFDSVRAVFSVLLPVLTAVSVFLWAGAVRAQISRIGMAVAVVLVLVSYPVLEGLFAQQAGLLVGAALAMSVAAMIRRRLFLAGVLLACGTVKPQMVWLLALWLMLWVLSDWKSRRSLALGFLLTLGVLCAASELILPGWISGWWHTLTRYSGYTLPPLALLVLGTFLGTALSLAMLVLCGAMCWRTRRKPADTTSFALTMSLVLAVTVMLLPTGGAVYDQVILLPAIFLLWSRRAEIFHTGIPLRVLGIAAAIAMSWQWIGACAVALASLLFPSLSRSAFVLVLPTRMAAPLPFVLLAMLAFLVGRQMRGDAAPASTELSSK